MELFIQQKCLLDRFNNAMRIKNYPKTNIVINIGANQKNTIFAFSITETNDNGNKAENIFNSRATL